MEEGLITISQLNDFVFCPVSIYFHKLYSGENQLLYQRIDQVGGTIAHRSIDESTYSSKSDIITGMDVYSEEYGLIGKIDIFDNSTGKLVERKKKVHQVFDGFVFQMYAQYYCLIEMGYTVNTLVLRSLDDNRNYKVLLPDENMEMKNRFVSTIQLMHSFKIEEYIQTNADKCKGCIYEPLCDRSLI